MKKSPSSRGRGLKFGTLHFALHEKVVALFTRAWIEISCHEKLSSVRAVALFTRAWIEI